MNKENKENLIPVKGLSPFKRFCMTIGELPASYLETMTYYEMLVWFTKYMQETVIPTINNNASAVDELQNKYIEFTDNLLDRQTTFENNLTERQENYEEEVMTLFNNLQDFVNNYFNNLDVQEEINNKLDKMAEDGILQEIIADYLNSKAIFGFDNVELMKNATNLINGSYAQTLGFYEKNDGGNSLYKIRNITNEDTVNEMNIIALSNTNLVAELINDIDLNLKQFGIIENTNIDENLEKGIEYCENKNINLIIPAGKYNISKEFTIPPSMKISGKRTGNWFDNDEKGVTILNKTNETNAFKLSYLSELSYLTINGNNNQGSIIKCGARNYVHDIALKNFDIGIQNTTESSNLARFERLTLVNGNIAINILNNNNSNTQSCTFKDIDIRECNYGLITYQPSNKFYNFCVQNGKTGGNSIILNNGANNNLFDGTYLENANYENEVDLTTSKYNVFIGCRVLQYLIAFKNNNGSNIIECNSIQNQSTLIKGGFNAFEKIGVMVGINNDQPSQYLTIEKDEQYNLMATVKTNGSSSDTLIKYDNVRQELTNAKFQTGNYQKFNTPFFYKRTITPSSLTSGQSTSLDTSAINKPNIIGIANTNKPNVYAQIITRAEGGFRIILTNNSTIDYSGQDIDVYIFGCQYES